MTFEFIKAETTEDIVEPVKEPVVDLSQYLQENPTIPDTPMCSTCPAFDKMNMLPVQGEGRLGIMVVLSHPTKGDIDMGRYSVSQSYVHMAKYLDKIGVDIDRDCWVTSAVRCNAGGMIPEKKAFECCRPRLKSTVKRFKPFVVFVVGRNAMSGWKGHQFSIPPRVPDYSAYVNDREYTKWVGNQIPDTEYAFEIDGQTVKPVVIPLFNTHDVANAEASNMKFKKISSVLPLRHARIIENGVTLAIRIKENLPQHIINQKNIYRKHSKTVLLHTVEQCVQALQLLNTKTIVAFDYETTGIKPYNKGHRILMVGIADGEHSYAMPFFTESREFMQAYKELLTNTAVKKVAHNFKFEYVWTHVILGFDVAPVYWDTMIGAHILDMRDGVVGLKIQGYLQYGDAGYEKVTKKLLGPMQPTKRKNTNAMNWLSVLNPEQQEENSQVWDLLLEYVAQDASLTLALYYKQRQDFAQLDMAHLMKGMNLFMESTITLADMEINGFTLDIDALKRNKLEIKERMVGLKQEMFTSKEYDKWLALYPDKDINVNSSKQLQEFFFEILKYRPTKFTKKGAPATDKEALGDMGSEFADKLLEYKTLDKLGSAFLTSYMTEANDDGKIRTLFNLTGVTSYRTSSASINIQQVSHHSVESKYVLNILKPHKGHIMLNMDFKSLEVYTSAAHTWAIHDKSNLDLEGTLKKYLVNPDSDMHKDMACDVYFLEPEEVTKDLRSRVKRVTFGITYGSGAKSLAHNQWKFCTAEDKAHLAEHGINNYEDFVVHMQNILWRFWNVRFKEYGEWKKRVWSFYVKYGYFVGLTGFLYLAPDVSERGALNFSIQGDSAHILLALSNYINKELKTRGMKSVLLAEIHDSVMVSAEPSEIPFIYEKVHEFLRDLPKLYPFTEGFNYTIECEQSAIDGSWGEVEAVAAIDGTGIKYL